MEAPGLSPAYRRQRPTDDLLLVRDLLGHATVKTTEHYVRGRVSHLRAAMAGRSYASTP